MTKGQGTRDKGQGTRDKGQGTRDKGQGTVIINRKTNRIPTFMEFQKRWLREMELLSGKLANVPEATIEMEHYPQTFFKTHNIRGRHREDLLKASLDFVAGMKEVSEKNALRRNKKLWDKIETAEATMNRVAEHQNIPMNGKGMAGFIGFLFIVLYRFPATFSKFYHIN